jgi:predicted amidohydrolase YtcJ
VLPIGSLLRPDLILHGGNLITIDPRQPRAQALAVRGDSILAVGTDADILALAGPPTRRINLRGRTVVPGFNDAHNHMSMFGEALKGVDLQEPPARSIAEIQERIRARARQVPPGTWLIARGYDNNWLPGQAHPTRFDLDAAAPDHFVQCIHTSGHMRVLSSKALAFCGIDRETADPEGGRIVRDAAGQPNGLLQELAQELADKKIYPLRVDEIIEALRLADQRYLSEGLTSAQEAIIGRLSPREIKAWQEAVERDALHVRINFMVEVDYLQEVPGGHGEESIPAMHLGMRTGFGDHRLRIGPVKMFADGSLIGRTAAMFEPFATDPGNIGFFVVEEDLLKERILRLHKAGWQIAIHAIGDRGVATVLDGYEAALKAAPRADHRHRIEHAGVVTPAILDRMAHLGVLGVPQQHFIYRTGDGYLANLGRERARWCYPQKAYLDRKMVLSGSSDRPVVPGAPLLGIHDAVNQRTASGQPYVLEEAITVEQALTAYTLGSAYASFEERVKGSLEAGKLADLVVLGADPTAVDPAALREVPVLAAMVGGRMLHTASGADDLAL